ncbi:hypothetical protein M9458_057609 [Cirrhinus mrigala]|uniref:Reverse transcriptase domain-containing protein n=1 Tax=Cirrhinus mrigala TaxID=683832 RepID=A0ABD0MC13_CIRMR
MNTLHFRTLVAANVWNETALLGAYRQGLNPDIRAAMALYDDSIGLESFLQRTTRVSQWLAACLPSATAPQPASVAASSPVPERMQIDSTRLSRNDCHHCLSNGLSLLWTTWSSPTYLPHQTESRITSPCGVPVLLSSTQVESPEPSCTPEVPAEYMAFQDVFSKQAATHLPPHRPWDCAIGLLPGAQLPKGRIYPLSIPEHQAMEEYITEALSQGFIQPSTSPAASSFFFVGKKDGGLRRCIDYRQLNSQIRQPYPPPLVPAALEELSGAQVFTKLDLWSAYNLIRIHAGNEWKMAIVTPKRGF